MTDTHPLSVENPVPSQVNCINCKMMGVSVERWEYKGCIRTLMIVTVLAIMY